MRTVVSAASTPDGPAAPAAEPGMAWVGTPLSVREGDIAEIAFNDDGLVPAIIQDRGSGEVLMLGWMDETALRRTLESGRTWFWSRSRREYWCKGETSGNRQWVRAASYDCDGDTVLVVVDQEGGGACHTGQFSCFHRPFGDGAVE